jgi:hypothetical protein
VRLDDERPTAKIDVDPEYSVSALAVRNWDLASINSDQIRAVLSANAGIVEALEKGSDRSALALPACDVQLTRSTSGGIQVPSVIELAGQ